jgi:hypothetical protein
VAQPTATPTPAAPPTSDPEIVARLASKRDKWRTQAKTAQEERDAARQERDALKTELDQLKASPASKQVEQLRQQLRETKHRVKFDELARAKGVDPESLDLFYQLSGYTPEADEIDEDAIGGLIDEQKAKPGVSRLFGEASAPAGAAETPVKPAVAGGKGGTGAAKASPYSFSDGDPRLSDVKYQFLNFAKISEAAQQRLARGEI